MGFYDGPETTMVDRYRRGMEGQFNMVVFKHNIELEIIDLKLIRRRQSAIRNYFTRLDARIKALEEVVATMDWYCYNLNLPEYKHTY